MEDAGGRLLTMPFRDRSDCTLPASKHCLAVVTNNKLPVSIGVGPGLGFEITASQASQPSQRIKVARAQPLPRGLHRRMKPCREASCKLAATPWTLGNMVQPLPTSRGQAIPGLLRSGICTPHAVSNAWLSCHESATLQYAWTDIV